MINNMPLKDYVLKYVPLTEAERNHILSLSDEKFEKDFMEAFISMIFYRFSEDTTKSK